MSVDKDTEQIFGAAIAAVDEKPAEVPSELKDGVTSGDIAALSSSGSVPTTEPLTRLAQFVINSFMVNADHRRNSGIDQRLKDAILANTCSYTEAQKDKMRRAGIDQRVFTPITATKIRGAKSMLVDIFNSSGEWPFTLSPTPDPDLPNSVREQIDIESQAKITDIFNQILNMGVDSVPPEVMGKLQRLIVNWVNGRYDEIANMRDSFAINRAKRMERKVHDIMTEGGWLKAFYECINYVCTYGTGIIIGPVPKTVPQNKCKENKKTGTLKYTREYKTIPTFEAVDPNDCYPAPDARYVEDGALCFRVRYMPNELSSFVMARSDKTNSKTGNGWMMGTLRSLIRKWPHGGCKINFEQRDLTVREVTNQGKDDTRDCTLEGIRCFASVIGMDLIQFGIVKNIDGKDIEPDLYYATETIVIDGYVVYCRIIDDKMGRPVSKAVFYELPSSWWGESIADKLYLVQSVMNNCIKALMQNMAVASGPMYWINDVTRLTNKSPDALQPRPYKIWGFNASYGAVSNGVPMGTIQVPSNATELLAVWEKMRIQADDDSGIPAYTYGQSAGQGALRTASGLAIFTESASRGIKMIIEGIDRNLTRDQVKKVCNWILLYDDDIDIKGDCEVNPAGIMGKILKAQQDQQRLQFLNMAISNPMLNQLFGAKGIVALLRPSIQDLAINPDDCLPSDEKLREMELIAGIKQIFEATQASQGVQQAAADSQGAVPGIEQPPTVQGGVAERRSVA